ncbi:MAG: hypothetical protein H5T86_08510, partial [Armatimonadetes bacterium]|nr:hypothetical protein [Armatimonadota bacterium]
MSAARKRTATRTADPTELLLAWSTIVLRVCVVAVIIAYGYYAWAVIGGYLSKPVDARIMNNLRIMGTALIASSLVGTVSLLIVTFEEVAWAVLAGLIGAGMLFGTPVLIASYVRGGQTPSVVLVGQYTAWAGETIIALSMLRVLYEVFLYMRLGSRRPREEGEGEKFRKRGSVTAKIWARCWDMPYCHEAVRENCPAYKAHRTCWKFGYGCMCNPKLIEALIRASATGATAAAKARQAEYVRSDLEADMVIRPDERTIPCTKCAIFIEHQRQKFRIINPIVAVATIAGMAVAYAPLMRLYRAFVRLLSNLAAQFTLTDRVNPADWFT